MDKDIMNLEQAMEFFGVSERTMIKLLKEEQLPARKIGREWRFNRQALLDWLGEGSSAQYLNQQEQYRVYEDYDMEMEDIYGSVERALIVLKNNGGAVNTLLDSVDSEAHLPNKATLRVSFKRQRGLEKLTFKIFWFDKSNTGKQPEEE